MGSKMIDRSQIEQWTREKVISEQQAERMLADVLASNKERTSGRFIATIATIGVLLVGAGTVMFVVSRWDVLQNQFKVALLLGGTILSFYLGYFCAYVDKRLPKVGSALILLGTLLFGATLFITTQIYQVNLQPKTLLFLWFIGVFPVVYVFKSPMVAGVSSILANMWIADSLFGYFSGAGSGDFYYAPVFFIVAGALLSEIGVLHDARPGLEMLGRMYRFCGTTIVLLSLFILTFRFSSESYWVQNSKFLIVPNQWLPVIFYLICLLGIALGAFRLIRIIRMEPVRFDASFIERFGIFFFVSIALLLFVFPPQTLNFGFLNFIQTFIQTVLPGMSLMRLFYALLLNGLFVFSILQLLFVGYVHEDIVFINSGLFWSFLFILVRYFDFFWNLFDRSLFFLVGGILFIGLGIMMERKRRVIKGRFGRLSSN